MRPHHHYRHVAYDLLSHNFYVSVVEDKQQVVQYAITIKSGPDDGVTKQGIKSSSSFGVMSSFFFKKEKKKDGRRRYVFS